MNNPLVIKNTIEILTPAPRVWDALVNPEKTKQYMFGAKQFPIGRKAANFCGEVIVKVKK